MSKPTAKRTRTSARRPSAQSTGSILPIIELADASGPKKAKRVSADTDLVFVIQDAGKKAAPPKGPYSALVEKFRKGLVFQARLGSMQLVRFAGKKEAENVLLLGLGQTTELTEEKIRSAGGLVWAKSQAEKIPSLRIQADGITQAQLVAFLEGMTLPAYQWNEHKSKKADEKEPPRLRVIVESSDKAHHAQLAEEIARVAAVGEAVTITRNWSNQPSNIGTPEYYAAEAMKIARAAGLKCKVLTEKEAEREKMGLFLAVGQGSEREGRIVVIEYAPKAAKGSKTIALVGKGVTFDSGGISIKPAMRMEEMKHDMTGAATVMGALYLASKTGVQNRIVGIMAFTENMPSGNAVQPGNVITSRSGKTVEIFNTDAEGRLVLADALDYAHEFKPDAIIDVATLTGAVVVALGKHACGLLGNNETLIEAVKRAGDACGERMWQLPMFDEYFDDMKSETADMKNSVNDGNGGTIRGAIFLKQFIKKDVAWAHLDIAGTGYNVSHLSYFPKRGASGAFVRSLARLCADF